MRLEHISCPYCGADHTEPWGEDNGFFAVRCRCCDLVYVNPRPPLDAIREATRIGLHDTEAGKVHTVGLLRFRQAKVRMYLKRLPEMFPGNSLVGREVSWLDVGCGFGELLAAVSRIVSPSSVVEGVDPSEPKIKIADRRGLNVKVGTLADLDRAYSIISLINVFSHLPQPAQFLDNLPRFLEPGGRLFLVTGNGADVLPEEYPDPLFLPDHLVFAGEKHVVGLLERTGFELIRLKAYRYFLPESPFLVLIKNVARTVLGRPAMPLHNKGLYRSLFVHARLRP